MKKNYEKRNNNNARNNNARNNSQQNQMARRTENQSRVGCKRSDDESMDE